MSAHRAALLPARGTATGLTQLRGELRGLAASAVLSSGAARALGPGGAVRLARACGIVGAGVPAAALTAWLREAAAAAAVSNGGEDGGGAVVVAWGAACGVAMAALREPTAGSDVAVELRRAVVGFADAAPDAAVLALAAAAGEQAAEQAEAEGAVDGEGVREGGELGCREAVTLLADVASGGGGGRRWCDAAAAATARAAAEVGAPSDVVRACLPAAPHGGTAGGPDAGTICDAAAAQALLAARGDEPGERCGWCWRVRECVSLGGRKGVGACTSVWASVVGKVWARAPVCGPRWSERCGHECVGAKHAFLGNRPGARRLRHTGGSCCAGRLAKAWQTAHPRSVTDAGV
eukprot:365780-Chlamydomonas_euryale.AAC.1